MADGKYHPATNYHGTPEHSFLISPAFLQTFASVEAIAHSHPMNKPWPSAADMDQQRLMDLPWAIASLDVDSEGKPFCNDLVWWGDSLPPLPLLDRVFRPGIQDCYALVRAFYRQSLDIDLPDFPRDDAWWEKEPGRPPQNLFAEGFREAGFEPIDGPVRVNDVFGVPYMQSVINHCGVFVEGDLVLHHFSGRLSNIEPAYKWTRRAKEAGLILRHWSQK